MQTRFVLQICIAMLLWGGSWSASKIIVSYTTVDVLAFLRFILATLSFMPMVLLWKIRIKISFKIFMLLILSSIANVMYAVCFFQGISVGLAGAGGVLVTTLIPISTFLLVFIVYRKAPTRLECIGLGLGMLSGIMLLDLLNPMLLLESGNLYFMLSAFIWAALTLILQHIHPALHPIAINFYINCFSIALYAPFVSHYDQLLHIFEFDWVFWTGLLFVSCLAIGVGTTLYYQAIKQLGSSKASAFNLLVPINAMLLSWILLGEQPTLNTLVGGGIAIIAILCLSFRGLKK